MTLFSFSDFSIRVWFWDAWGEAVRYFSGMDTTHYGILAACAVAFGFLCLKGPGIHR